MRTSGPPHQHKGTRLDTYDAAVLALYHQLKIQRNGSVSVTTVLIKVAAFVSIIVAGYYAGRSGKLGRGTGNVLSKIVFNLTLPCAVIHAFGSAEFTLDLLWLFVVAAAFNFVAYFAMFIATRRSERAARVYYLCNICGYNIGCFALPFVQAFFPAAQAVAVCLFDAGNSLMMSGGTYALTSVIASEEPVDHPARLAAKRLFSSVTIDAYLVLVTLALLRIPVPQAVVQFTEPMANANAFLAMFMLGLVTNLHVDAQKVSKLVRLLGARLAFNVLFTAATLLLLPFGASVRVIVCMAIWAPIGAMGPVFTMWCHGDHGLAGFANAISVIAAIIVMTGIVLATGVVG